MLVEMDFVDDIIVGLTAELMELGYVVPAPAATKLETAHRVGVQHWNAFARRIPVRPRAVHRSPKLVVTEAGLPEPIRRGLAVVAREFELGIDLTPRLSRQLSRLGHRDQMLNDWGFHHLHLHDADRAAGTAHVLIVLAHPDDAYLIDARAHGHWSDQDLVEIVHETWPGALEEHRQRTALGLVHAVSDHERAILRANGWNAPIEMADGAVYMAVGGGIAKSGDNLRAVHWIDWLLAQAKLVEAFLDDQREWLDAMIAHQLGSRPKRIRVHLMHVRRDRARLCFEHGGQTYVFEQPIREPPRTVIDLIGDTFEQ